MTIMLVIIMGAVWAFSSYRLAMKKGRKNFAPFAAILGFLIGLIGFAIVACFPATPEAKERRAQAKAAKAGLFVPTVPPDLHEEHNLLPGQYSGAHH